MSVPDTRGESEDGEGPAGGRAGHSWHCWGLVTGPGTWQLETVDGELGMVQVAMALVKIAEWQWRWGWRPEWRQGKRRWAHEDGA